MTIQDVLKEMRSASFGMRRVGLEDDAQEFTKWADAIEAAMRERVAEVRHANGTTFCVFDPDLSHGTKLYAFPPDAQAEIERLREALEPFAEIGSGFDMDDVLKARAALAGKQP